jgi:hypothetical protein
MEARPEVYRDNFHGVRVSGPNGGPIESTTSVSRRISTLTDKQLQQIILGGTSQELLDGSADEMELVAAEGLESSESSDQGRLRLTGPDVEEPG